MPSPDVYERRWQPLVKRFLTLGKRKQVYVSDLVRICTLFVWPYFMIRAAGGTFEGAKINMGSGASRLQGWVNADANPLRRPDVWMDVRNSWPFKTASIAGIATSHLLEHLFDEEFKFVLGEIFRVLKPRGFLRVSVPDLDKAISDYLAESPDRSQDLEARGERFNKICHSYGAHHQIFNFARLRKLLLRVGFVDVEEQHFPSSNFLRQEEVVEIDLHPAESVFVECIKPARGN